MSSTVDVIGLGTLGQVSRLDVAREGEPGAPGLAYLPRPA